MKENVCGSVQESIAIGAKLGDEQQRHLSTCHQCQAVLSEYQQLENLFALNFEANIPLNFADAVMSRIEEESVPVLNDWFAHLQTKIFTLMGRPSSQWAMVSLGAAMSVSNLARFVLFILTPVS